MIFSIGVFLKIEGVAFGLIVTKLFAKIWLKIVM